MSTKTQNDKIIFGLKVKQLRQHKQLSFADLSERSGLSISYLNEIEKGKKYPKEDKIDKLALSLGVSAEKLTSRELDKELAPVSELLRSNFLNELPLELFGMDLAKIVEIIANSPIRVGAFISTLLELSRNYALKEENFYFGALRSYLELHYNYFEELEAEVDRFTNLYNIDEYRPIPIETLSNLLEERYKYTIVEDGLAPYPELNQLRSVYLQKKKELLLNGNLNAMQKSFQFGKELGFNFLELKERAHTSSILRGRVFEEVLNHSKAIYFSVALHLPKEHFVAQLKQFFGQRTWNADAFLDLMNQYRASPEMFAHRLTNILPQFFGMHQLFFLRFIHRLDENRFEVDRELHLNKKHHPHGNNLNEHYCRRWIAISSLLAVEPELDEHPKAAIQRAHFIGTEDEYLCFNIQRTAYPSPKKNVSVTIGLLITEELSKKIQFLEDPAIPRIRVNQTCERCSLMDCAERAAPPVIHDQKEKWNKIQHRLQQLIE